MPAWCSVQPDGSVREPPKEEPRSLSSLGNGGDKASQGDGDSDFYSGTSPEYSSEDGSDSDPYDSASGSGSETESSSGSVSDESVSGSDSESESDSSSDGDSSSSNGSQSASSSGSSTAGSSSSGSSSTQGAEGVGLLIMGSGASNTAATYGASAPAPHPQDLTGLVERMVVQDEEDSASSPLGSRAGSLGSLSMAGVRPPSVGGGSSASSNRAMDPEGDTSASFPSTLLSHQSGGGLQVDYRYARGRASAISRPSTTLGLRLTLSNHHETPIRRIRAVAPRDGTPMEAFPEVQVLAPGAAVSTNLGIDFGGKIKEVCSVVIFL